MFTYRYPSNKHHGHCRCNREYRVAPSRHQQTNKQCIFAPCIVTPLTLNVHNRYTDVTQVKYILKKQEDIGLYINHQQQKKYM